jgi:RNA polymerase sigma factor (sigma-70 family)
VLINVRRDQWRKQSVRRRHDDRARGVDRTADHESAAVARATIWSALDTLTPRRRAIVILHELEEQPIAAIAAMLRISAITVRWHLAIARRDLARVLGRGADGS